MAFADRRVTVEGRQVAYADRGPEGGVPCVLLHGGGFDHAGMTWRGTVEALGGRFRFIIPDLPGYGASDRFDGPHDLARLGNWLAAFLDAVGVDRADVSGVSMGGGMALWLAIERPERVRRLVPVCPFGIMPRVPFHPLAVRLSRSGTRRFVYRALGSSRWLARRLLGLAYADPKRITPDALDDLMAVARDQSERQTFDGFMQRELRPDGIVHDLSPRLSGIRAPTLLIQGDADRLVAPRHARRAAPLIPGARLAMLPAGHWPMRERPDLFQPLFAEFLAG